MIVTQTAGGVVLNSRGQVLLVTHGGSGAWTLPKGHIEPGESEEVAAHREITEESGITQLTLIKKLGMYERPPMLVDGRDNPDEMKTFHIFLFTTEEESLQPVDPHNPEARWIESDEVAAMLTHPKDKAFYVQVLPQVQDFIAQ